ncbi:unnamed protein product [Caenorhabditis auriculariae]|uniref:Uncharacterized protein n=1 Tax=Caenorhabditis auriculariae TaxID=2777116 RepID=A0A8S1HCK3_9PELO|nr:unnamed protein product [Caenorhabditis auriculariae]
MTRDDCESLASRTSGSTIVCAVLTSIDPPTIRDSTGSLVLKCQIPVHRVHIEPGDTCLFRFTFDETGSALCDQVTAIPPLLAPVYDHLLAEYRTAVRNSLLAP